MDGKFLDRDSATVSVFDHGLLYGDGVFEGIRAYNQRVFRLERHLDRLDASAKAVWLEIPLDTAAMGKMEGAAVLESARPPAYIRRVWPSVCGDRKM